MLIKNLEKIFFSSSSWASNVELEYHSAVDGGPFDLISLRPVSQFWNLLVVRTVVHTFAIIKA